MNSELKEELQEHQSESSTEELLKKFDIPYRVKYGSDVEQTIKEFSCLKRILTYEEKINNLYIFSSEKVNILFGEEVFKTKGFITAFMINVILDKLLEAK